MDHQLPATREAAPGRVLVREDAAEVLRCYRDFAAAAAPEVATIVNLRRAPTLAVLPLELHGRPVCIVSMAYFGDPARGERVLAPLRGFGRPLLDAVAVRPYTMLQSMVDATAPPGWHYYALFDVLSPYECGLYLNFLDGDDDQRLTQAFDPHKRASLLAIKQRYDPANLFRATALPAAKPSRHAHRNT